jgi:hypothetical protein
MNRDPLGDEAFFAQYTANKSRQVTRKLREESSRPAYLFVGNDSLNKLDLLGLAYFSYRPLGGAMGWLGIWGEKPGSADDKMNTVIGHEQLFFEDGKEPSNIGFFDDRTLQSEADTSKYRKSHDSGWNDCVMRKAVKDVPLQTYCLLGKPGPTDKFNCQDWAEAARKEYRRLIKDEEVLKECCPTEAEKKK